MPQTSTDHPAALVEPGGTFVEPSWNLTSDHPGPPRSPRRTWNPCGTLRSPCRIWWNPGGTLVEPPSRGTLPQTTPDHLAALAEPGGTLVERSWNLASNLHGPPRCPRRTWWNFRGTLVEPYLRPPRTTPDHPAALAEPGGTLVELSPYLRAAPDHPGPYLG